MIQLITQEGAFDSTIRKQINANFNNLGFATQGNIYWVRPRTGNDNNNGQTSENNRSDGVGAVKTVARGLALCTAGQNDIVLLCAEGNAASDTTDHTLALTTWNKDCTHLIGVNAGPLYSQRSRIAFDASYAAATDLFLLSANDCVIANIEMFMGVASVLPTGCLTITGQRNRLTRCHIAGMGNTANDISGAYSLQLKGAQENLFEDCTIGQDTIQLGAGTSNSVMLFTNSGTGCTRNWFRNCRFLLDTSSATVCLFLRSGATAMDRETIFEDCLFINAILSGATTLTHAMAVLAGTSPSGVIILTGSKTGLLGASGWNATSGVIYATGGPIPVAGTYGTAVAITS